MSNPTNPIPIFVALRAVANTQSLKGQLILWLVLLLTLMSALSAALTFFLGLNEANRLMDRQLVHIARSVDEGSQLPAMRDRFRAESSTEQQEDFVIQVWMLDAPTVRTSRPDFNLPRALHTGFSVQRLPQPADDRLWRVYTVYYPDRVVQVSQDERVRLDIATHSAMRALMPVLLLIPLSWLVIGLIVSRVMKPVEKITQLATVRDINSLDPLPTDGIPAEIAPLISAINSMVDRLTQALSAQRAFLSDAAHELRTPLAALQLQIDNLRQSPNQEQFELRLGEMQRGIHRATHLVAQLLRISRYEAKPVLPIKSRIDLNALIKTLIADYIPLASQHQIDLGLIQDDTACVEGDTEDIRILLGNLIDNAIRYTQPNGRVDIAVQSRHNKIQVQVCDTGSGIPSGLLPRVFDRFFRAAGQETEGSGIGLAIVKTIAERESIVVTLNNRTDAQGLIAICEFAPCVTKQSEKFHISATMQSSDAHSGWLQ